MGRESNINDPIVIQSSSIALLQERFRQLQRMKEMREERELLRKLVVAEPKQCNPDTTTTTTTTTSLPYHGDDHLAPMPSGLLFFHFLPPRSTSPPPHHQVPQYSTTNFRYMDEPVFASLLPTVVQDTPPSLHVLKKFQGLGSDDIIDVDTSLHL